MATVIKAGSTGPLLPRLGTVALADYLAEARSVVPEAKRRAEQIETQARLKAERILAEVHQQSQEAGFQEGFGRGMEAGFKAGREAAHAEALARFKEEHSQIVSSFQQAIAEVEACKAEWRLAAERDVLEFAITAARKLTFAVGMNHSASVVENLRKALRLMEAASTMTIRVHPEELEVMRTLAPQVLSELARSETVAVVPDERLARGGCVVANQRTTVDASLDTQLDELVGELLSRSVEHA